MAVPKKLFSNIDEYFLSDGRRVESQLEAKLKEERLARWRIDNAKLAQKEEARKKNVEDADAAGKKILLRERQEIELLDEPTVFRPPERQDRIVFLVNDLQKNLGLLEEGTDSPSLNINSLGEDDLTIAPIDSELSKRKSELKSLTDKKSALLPDKIEDLEEFPKFIAARPYLQELASKRSSVSSAAVPVSEYETCKELFGDSGLTADNFGEFFEVSDGRVKLLDTKVQELSRDETSASPVDEIIAVINEGLSDLKKIQKRDFGMICRNLLCNIKSPFGPPIPEGERKNKLKNDFRGLEDILGITDDDEVDEIAEKFELFFDQSEDQTISLKPEKRAELPTSEPSEPESVADLRALAAYISSNSADLDDIETLTNTLKGESASEEGVEQNELETAIKTRRIKTKSEADSVYSENISLFGDSGLTADNFGEFFEVSDGRVKLLDTKVQELSRDETSASPVDEIIAVINEGLSDLKKIQKRDFGMICRNLLCNIKSPFGPPIPEGERKNKLKNDFRGLEDILGITDDDEVDEIAEKFELFFDQSEDQTISLKPEKRAASPVDEIIAVINEGLSDLKKIQKRDFGMICRNLLCNIKSPFGPPIPEGERKNKLKNDFRGLEDILGIADDDEVDEIAEKFELFFDQSEDQTISLKPEKRAELPTSESQSVKDLKAFSAYISSTYQSDLSDTSALVTKLLGGQIIEKKIPEEDCQALEAMSQHIGEENLSDFYEITDGSLKFKQQKRLVVAQELFSHGGDKVEITDDGFIQAFTECVGESGIKFNILPEMAKIPRVEKLLNEGFLLTPLGQKFKNSGLLYKKVQVPKKRAGKEVPGQFVERDIFNFEFVFDPNFSIKKREETVVVETQNIVDDSRWSIMEKFILISEAVKEKSDIYTKPKEKRDFLVRDAKFQDLLSSMDDQHMKDLYELSFKMMSLKTGSSYKYLKPAVSEVEIELFTRFNASYNSNIRLACSNFESSVETVDRFITSETVKSSFHEQYSRLSKTIRKKGFSIDENYVDSDDPFYNIFITPTLFKADKCDKSFVQLFNEASTKLGNPETSKLVIFCDKFIKLKKEFESAIKNGTYNATNPFGGVKETKIVSWDIYYGDFSRSLTSLLADLDGIDLDSIDIGKLNAKMAEAAEFTMGPGESVQGNKSLQNLLAVTKDKESFRRFFSGIFDKVKSEYLLDSDQAIHRCFSQTDDKAWEFRVVDEFVEDRSSRFAEEFSSRMQETFGDTYTSRSEEIKEKDKRISKLKKKVAQVEESKARLVRKIDGNDDFQEARELFGHDVDCLLYMGLDEDDEIPRDFRMHLMSCVTSGNAVSLSGSQEAKLVEKRLREKLEREFQEKERVIAAKARADVKREQEKDLAARVQLEVEKRLAATSRKATIKEKEIVNSPRKEPKDRVLLMEKERELKELKAENSDLKRTKTALSDQLQLQAEKERQLLLEAGKYEDAQKRMAKMEEEHQEMILARRELSGMVAEKKDSVLRSARKKRRADGILDASDDDSVEDSPDRVISPSASEATIMTVNTEMLEEEEGRLDDYKVGEEILDAQILEHQRAMDKARQNLESRQGNYLRAQREFEYIGINIRDLAAIVGDSNVITVDNTWNYRADSERQERRMDNIRAGVEKQGGFGVLDESQVNSKLAAYQAKLEGSVEETRYDVYDYDNEGEYENIEDKGNYNRIYNPKNGDFVDINKGNEFITDVEIDGDKAGEFILKEKSLKLKLMEDYLKFRQKRKEGFSVDQSEDYQDKTPSTSTQALNVVRVLQDHEIERR